jgi:hypothetical protein
MGRRPGARGRRAWPLLLLLALPLGAAPDPLLALLPADTVPTGWARRGEAQLFAGAELYRHVNGGAELYHRHGFERLAVQDYAGGSREVRVEIYKMATAAGAAALFAEINAGLATSPRFGEVCVLDDFQVMFRRGECCVTLTTYESSAEATAAMAAMAAAIDAALRDPAF